MGKLFRINLDDTFISPNAIDISQLEGPLTFWMRNPDADTVEIALASVTNPGIESDWVAVATSALTSAKINVPLDEVGNLLRVRITLGTGANITMGLVGRSGSRFL